MNPNPLGPSWLPKVGAIICIVGVGLRKHTNPSVSFWADILEQVGILITGWFARQNNVSSEQAGVSKPDPSAQAGVKALMLVFALTLLSGCSSILPGNDPLVVRAEQTEKTAISTFKAFVHIEAANREFLRKLDPNIKVVADKVRSDSTNWVMSLDRVVLAYKHNRSESNNVNVATALATLEASLAETQKYLSQAKSK